MDFSGPELEPGSEREAEWMAQIQPKTDVVRKGTDVMGKTAGSDDAMAINVSEYLVSVAVPTVVTNELTSRQILPHRALSGAMRFTIPAPGVKKGTLEAEVCSRFADATCQVEYVTLLKHTYDHLMAQYTNRSGLMERTKSYIFPVFVPFHKGKVRWDSVKSYGKERMEILKTQESGLVIFALVAAVVFLLICIINRK